MVQRTTRILPLYAQRKAKDENISRQRNEDQCKYNDKKIEIRMLVLKALKSIYLHLVLISISFLSHSKKEMISRKVIQLFSAHDMKIITYGSISTNSTTMKWDREGVTNIIVTLEA